MIIKNGTVITPFEEIKNADIVVHKDIVAKIGYKAGEDIEDELIDASGCYVCPGFVDIHTHGGFGGDFIDATEQAFENALKFHITNGTTSILASSVSAPIKQITNMLKLVRQYKEKENPICRVLGAHVEGPFLSERNKGAHYIDYLKIPSRDGYDFILENKDVIVNVTIAPELQGAVEMIRNLIKNGIIVSGGHKDDVAVLPDGSRYAGSLQPLSKMVKNLVNDCNIPIVDAVCMASYTPATIIHKEHLVGSVAVGKKADFCIMNKNLEVVQTIIDGKVVQKCCL